LAKLRNVNRAPCLISAWIGSSPVNFLNSAVFVKRFLSMSAQMFAIFPINLFVAKRLTPKACNSMEETFSLPRKAVTIRRYVDLPFCPLPIRTTTLWIG
jgi:hypothetical protein